jgi:hypothetical protein
VWRSHDYHRKRETPRYKVIRLESYWNIGRLKIKIEVLESEERVRKNTIEREESEIEIKLKFTV